jgi:hypothetical protein
LYGTVDKSYERRERPLRGFSQYAAVARSKPVAINAHHRRI